MRFIITFTVVVVVLSFIGFSMLPAATTKKVGDSLKQPRDTTPLIKKSLLSILETNKIKGIEFIDTPLCDAIEFMLTGVCENIVIDGISLGEEGIDTMEPVNLVLSNVTAHAALTIVLKEYGLAYFADEESGIIHIRSKVKDAENMYNVIYNCQDLLFPPALNKKKFASKIEVSSEKKAGFLRIIKFSEYEGRFQKLGKMLVESTPGPWMAKVATFRSLMEYWLCGRIKNAIVPLINY